MKSREFITEDDFWGDRPDTIAARDESERQEKESALKQFVEEWTDFQFGIPPASFSVNEYSNIRVSMPRDKGPRITHDATKAGMMKFEFRQMSEDLIEELRIADFGNYELATLSPYHFGLDKQDELMASRTQRPQAQQRIRKHKLRQ